MESDGPLRVLLLAPHPFYRERGTPIAVDLLLQTLSRRGARVEVLTFHEGDDRAYPGVTIRRIPGPRGVRNIPTGFSLKKLRCDIQLARLARERLRAFRPHVVHAVEEAVFIALGLTGRRGPPVVYDMDSSMAAQLVEKMGWLRPFGPVFRAFERRACRRALAVVPVCDALAGIARAHGARDVFLLTDVALADPDAPGPDRETLRRDLAARGLLFLYVGNLERYQGLDLLLASWARAAADEAPERTLAIVGGTAADIAEGRRRAATLGLADSVTFAGPRPVGDLPALLRAADVLVSPRIKGVNTPMKIYSYLAAGKAIAATDLPTHTQVLSPETAELAPPDPEAFAAALLRLARDPARRAALGTAAADLARARYNRAAYDRHARILYDRIETALGRPAGGGASN